MVLLPAWASYQENWLLNHVAIFDGENKIIRIAEHVTGVNVVTELYSDWKEWVQLSNDVNTRWDAAFRVVGGDSTFGVESIAGYFFLINGWQIVVDHGVAFTGNIFSDDFDSPFRAEDPITFVSRGPFLTTSRVTSIATTLDTGGSGGTSDVSADSINDIASAVWNATSSNPIAGTYGAQLDQQVSQVAPSVWLEPEGQQILSSSVLASGQTISGSTINILRTTLNESDSFYEGAFIRISDRDTGRSITRGIDGFLQVSGSVYVDTPLPFTPVTGSSVLVLAHAYRSWFGGVG